MRNADDDYASIIVQQFGSKTAEDRSESAYFTVRLTAEPMGKLTVPIQSDDETEGLPDGRGLRFLARWGYSGMLTHLN